MVRRPAATLRDWLRCFAGRAEAMRDAFNGWVRSLAADPVMPLRRWGLVVRGGCGGGDHQPSPPALAEFEAFY